ncbi:MAG: 30S ribosomal protein S17 [Spirochaetes bacterium]|nr:30S ribosomal protein S17 [Spirochaetota bacterium]MBN2769131.1 30S ribosomal protein S17 [Spirochaetota bacterium]
MENKKPRRQMVGKVTSNKMDKTAVVLTEKMTMHPLYKKYVKQSKKIKCHDEDNTLSIGDTVRIEETRPLSKDKRFTLVEIIEKVK